MAGAFQYTKTHIVDQRSPGGDDFTMSSVEERVKKVLAEQLAIKEEDIADDASLIEDLGADSLDIIEIMMGLENEFDLSVSDEEAEKTKTVKEVIEFVNANLE